MNPHEVSSVLADLPVSLSLLSLRLGQVLAVLAVFLIQGWN